MEQFDHIFIYPYKAEAIRYQRMNRSILLGNMREVDLLRRYFDKPSFTTDVIVGFPGETEWNLKKVWYEKDRFSAIHVFKYSKRAGTKAAEMADQVSEDKKL